MSVDTEVVETGLGRQLDRPATHLCRGQVDRFHDLLKNHDELLVCCTQEAPLFLELAEENEPATGLRFVNIREKAGWSREGRRAGAKMAALIAEAMLDIEGPAAMPIESDGIVLVLGSDDTAIAAAARLSDRMDVTLVLFNGAEILTPRIAEVPIFHGSTVAATGSFGNFELVIEDFAAASPSSRGTLAFEIPSREPGRSNCDIVLDLRRGPPLFSAPEKRTGYFRPAPDDAAAVASALFDIADLAGSFEKPRYIDYDAAICAHSRSEIIGCTRCIDACPTSAITPSGNDVIIDPGICAGCGNCASTCPTGAARYTMPDAAALSERMRTLLTTYRRAGGGAPTLLVHDGDFGEDIIDAIADHYDGLPPNLLPFAVNAVTQCGLDMTLAARVFGACHTLFLVAPDKAPETATLTETIELSTRVLDALGYGDGRLEIIDETDPETIGARLWQPADAIRPDDAVPDAFKPSGNKRDLMRLALAALHKAAPRPVDEVALPAGAPFGTVDVDVDGCTLCLSCVGACPANALKDNPDFPRLSFREEACVQCGLCVRTCPEKVISLRPRLDFTDAARTARVIKQDEPFMCFRCGQPFGTKSTIEAVVSRMAGHSMFADEKALSRLRMCSDCRVIDLAESNADPFALGPRPMPRTTDDYLKDRGGNGSDNS